MGWCREGGVHDAEAYLLEHYLGDYTAALGLCLAHLQRCAFAAVYLLLCLAGCV